MFVNGRQQVGIIAGHLIVVLIGFASATVLTYAGKLDSSAYTALVGTLLGLIGGGAVSGQGAATGASMPHQADTVVATMAHPVAGGKRSYDPPAEQGGQGLDGP